MIAKVHNCFFNIREENAKNRIWRFEPFEGATMRVTRSGYHLYEKHIDNSEVAEIFDVGFSALWNGAWCGFTISFATNRIEVYSNSLDFAKKYNMETIERYAYKKIIPISEVSEFKVVYMDCTGKTTHEETVILEQLKVLWKQFYTDLLPH